jgi:hypothetical protein
MTAEDGGNVDDGDAANHPRRDDFNATNHYGDFAWNVWLEGCYDDVLAAPSAATALVKQLERLSNAGRVSEKDLQLAASCGVRLGLDLAKQRIGIGPVRLGALRNGHGVEYNGNRFPLIVLWIDPRIGMAS